MLMPNPLRFVFVLSVISLSACTQVPPPKSQELKKEEQVAETLTEMVYKKLDLKRDQSGLYDLEIVPDTADSMKVKIYESQDSNVKPVEATLKLVEQKTLFEGVSALLGGKTEIKAGEESTAGAGGKKTLTLTEMKGDAPKAFVNPVLASAPQLIADLEKFIEENTKDLSLKSAEPQLSDEDAQDALAEEEAGLVYQKLDFRRDVEASNGIVIEADAAGLEEHVLTLKIYDACEPATERLKTDLSLEKEKDLYTAVIRLLAGKSAVRAADAKEKEAMGQKSTLQLVSEKAASSKDESKSIEDPVIESAPRLLSDLEALVQKKIEANEAEAKKKAAAAAKTDGSAQDES